jgi:hypothetical protein
MSRISEHDIGFGVLDVLANEPYGRATVRKIKQEIPNYVRLSSQDHDPSFTRKGEELWEQQVRNLKSHSKSPGNIFCDGYVVQVARGVWQLTPLGRRRVNGRVAA